jgi:hypothetical protein
MVQGMLKAVQIFVAPGVTGTMRRPTVVPLYRICFIFTLLFKSLVSENATTMHLSRAAPICPRARRGHGL